MNNDLPNLYKNREKYNGTFISTKMDKMRNTFPTSDEAKIKQALLRTEPI